MRKSGNWSLYLILLLALVGMVVLLKRSSKTNESLTPSSNIGQSTTLNRDIHRLQYSRHARCRMACRHIDSSEVSEILAQGVVNYRKSDTTGPRDPKYAIEGRTHDNQRVRIIIAMAAAKTVVVTVIDLDQDIQCDCP